jgi:CelD/BcsL family acetyltransferase involved in cellulose biosynthesis
MSRQCQRFIEISLRRSHPNREPQRPIRVQSTATIFEEASADARTPHGAPAAPAKGFRPDVALTIHEDLGTIEQDWRRFERHAACTVFQTFDWLAAWHRHIGARAGIRPAIVVGRGQGGEILFLLPLAIRPGIVRRLTWFGDDLCDYNAPLLAPDFSTRIDRDHFLALWAEIGTLLQRQPRLRHDVVQLDKMPAAAGDEPNPFLHLAVGLNPSGAHLTHLTGTWDAFYAARRSSATRRRDRAKLKRLGEIGAVRFVNPDSGEEIERTLETLFAQKTRSFARMGVANIFARPGYREFYLAIATTLRELVHVSRLDVGSTWAATNLGLQFRGCYYHILASYDDGQVSRFGPGAAHLRDLMQRATERGCDRFDFTIGDERYKLEWSDTAITLHDHIAAASARGWPVVLAALGARRVKRAIKQNPAVWEKFKRIRAAFGWLPGRRKDADNAQAPRVENSPSITPD